MWVCYNLLKWWRLGVYYFSDEIKFDASCVESEDYEAVMFIENNILG